METTMNTVNESHLGRTYESFLLMSFLVFTNFTVLANVPLLRQLTAVVLIVYLPGRILTQLLLENLTKLESVLMSVGASLAYVMMTTFAIQSILVTLGVKNPLDMNWLLLILDIEIAPLLLLFWLLKPMKVSRRKVKTPSVLRLSPKPVELLMCMCGVLLPILGLYGTDSFTRTGSNTLLLAALVLSVAYAGFLCLTSDRISKNVAAICLMLLSSTLLVIYGMSSRYFMGEDIYVEYYAFKVTALNGFWSMASFNSQLTASLSTSLLPTIFSSLMQENDLIVYKLLYPLMTATVPVFSYVIFQRYTKQSTAMIASILIASQIPFMFLLTHQMRVSICLIITASCLMLIFQSTRFQSKYKAMVLLLGIGVVISYYVTPVIFLAALLSIAILRQSKRGSARDEKGLITSLRIFVTIAIIHFSWWVFITGSDVLGYYTRYIISIGRDLSGLFDFSTRGTEVQFIFSVGGGLSDLVNKVATQLIVLILSITILIEVRRAWKKKRITAFLTVGTLFWILLVAAVVLPFISAGYGGDRLFIQVFPFISIFSAIGIIRFVSWPRFKKRLWFVPTAFICVVLLSNTFLIDQIAGVPRSPILNDDGRSHDVSYFYIEEVTAAEFLIQNCQRNSRIYLDLNPPGTGGLFDLANPNSNRSLIVTGEFFENYTGKESGFLVLRHANVINGEVYGRKIYSGGVDISRFSFLNNCSAILDSGSAKILLLVPQ